MRRVRFLRRIVAAICLSAFAAVGSVVAQGVVISEFMAANGGVLKDADGDTPDWIEIYNAGSQRTDLGGWSLSDDPDDPAKWTFAEGSRIEPGEFRIVFASGKDRRGPEGEWHTNFRLANEGGYIALIKPSGAIASAFEYAGQRENVSRGLAMSAETATLLESDADGVYVAPVDGTLGTDWTGGSEPYDDGTWTTASMGVGFFENKTLGLLGEWTFETAYGQPVSDGQGAEGQIDDSAGHAKGPFHAAGRGSGLKYVESSPESLSASRYSIQFHQNSSSVEYVSLDMPEPIAGLTQGDFALQTWFRTVDTDRSILMGSYTGSDNALNFELYTDNRLRVFIQNYQSGQTTDLNLSCGAAGNGRDGSWHLATAQRRGDTVELYMDGVSLGSATDVAGSYAQTAPRFYFGRDVRTDATRYDGELDHATMWTRALEPWEIRAMASGRAPTDIAGYQTLAQTDVREAMEGRSSSLFLRLPFNATAAGALNALRLTMRYDDGFVAYINGIEVARAHAPETVDWNSTATAARPIDQILEGNAFEIFAASQLLHEGENILAIHGLNVSRDDASFLIAPQLEGVSIVLDVDRAEFFEQPTPGKPNANGVQGLVEAVTFSPGRGFCDAPQSVRLATATPGATIRYTTDGSWPAADHGAIYSEAIRIDSTTVLRAAAFLEEHAPAPSVTHTYVFASQVLRQSAAPPGFPTEWQPGYPADYEMDPDVVDDPLYRDELEDDLKALPVMSLVMDIDDIFTQATGIYSNTLATGVGWERAASLEYFDPSDPEAQFQINAGVRMHGKGNRFPDRSAKHNFRVLFKQEYGPSKLDFPLFGDSYVSRFDTLVLRAGYNYTWIHASADQQTRAQYLRDSFTRATHAEMGDPASHGAYVHLYVNGLYWGLYQPQERPDASFLAEHFGGAKEDYDALNGNKPVDGDAEALGEMLRRARADLQDDDKYLAALEYVDQDSLIEYMLLNLFGGTVDWPISEGQLTNYYMGRRREEDAKFQFFIWDAEHTHYDVNVNRLSEDSADTPPWIFNRLRGHPEFRLAFADRVQRHFFNGGALTPERNIARYEAMASRIYPAIAAESARWGDWRTIATPHTRDNEWATERAWMTGIYFPRRTEVVLSQLRAAGLYPAIAAPEFSPFGGDLAPGFLLTMSAPSSGTIYYTLDGSDPRVAALLPRTIFLEEAAAKRALVPSGPLDEAWRSELDYDDSNWMEGSGGVGYEQSFRYDDYISIDVETMYGVVPSCFIRIPFEVSAERIPSIKTLELQARYDDGFVAYLNGKRLAGANAPESPAWNASASAGHPDSEAVEWESFDITPSLGDLRDGANLLAIQAFNESVDDSDFLISTRLLGFETSEEPGGVAAGATAYSEAIPLDRTTLVKARVWQEGEWSALVEATYSDSAVREGLRVSEVMYNPAPPVGGDSDDFEFIELHNIGPRAIDLAGVVASGGIDFVFADSFLLEANERVALVSNRAAFESRYGTEIRIAGEFSRSLADGGESVRIEDAFGEAVAEFEYDDGRGWPLAADGAGHSLVPLALGLAAPTSGSLDYGGNWRASTFLHGSPGAVDPEAPAGVVLNEISVGADSWIELWNRGASTVTLTNWFVSDSVNDLMRWTITDDTTVGPGGCIAIDAARIAEEGFDLSADGGEILLSHLPGASADRVVDALRYAPQSPGVSLGRDWHEEGSAYWMAMAPTRGARNGAPLDGLRISEIMYHPAEGGDAAQYVEIVNPTTEAVALESDAGAWRIGGGLEFALAPGARLEPGERLLIVPFDPANEAALTSFSAIYGVSGFRAALAGPWNGRLSGRGERIAIERPQASASAPDDVVWGIVDEAIYFDREPFPSRPDGEGYALERREADRAGNDPGNWRAELPTPGQEGAAPAVSPAGAWILY